jgi:hypothetical protein
MKVNCLVILRKKLKVSFIFFITQRKKKWLKRSFMNLRNSAVSRQFLIITSFLPGLLFSQNYSSSPSLQYHEGLTAVRLGGGIDASFPLKYRTDCLNDNTAYDPDLSATGGGAGSDQTNHAAAETTFDIEFVQSTEEIHELLNISGVIAGHMKFATKKIPKFGADLKLDGSKENSKIISETTMKLVVKMKANYGRQMTKSDELKPEYQALLDAGDYEKFERRCGTHFVKWQRREGMVSAIFTVDNLTNEQKSQLKMAFEAGAGDDPTNRQQPQNPVPPVIIDQGNTPGAGKFDPRSNPTGTGIGLGQGQGRGYNNLPVRSILMPDSYQPPGGGPPLSSNDRGAGIKARLSVDGFLNAVKKIGKNVTLSFEARGGRGFQDLGPLASNFNTGDDSFKEVLKGIANYLTNFTYHTAPPVEYFLVPYFDLEPTIAPLDNEALKNTYYLYQDIVGQMHAIQSHIEQLSVRDDQEELAYFREIFRAYESVRIETWNISQAILEGETYYQDELPELPKIQWNKFSASFDMNVGIDFIFRCRKRGETNECGREKKWFSPGQFWEGSFLVSAAIDNVNKVDFVNLIFDTRFEAPKVVATIRPGEAIDNGNQTISFGEGGFINFEIFKMRHDQLREYYIKLRQDYNLIASGKQKIMPEGYLEIVQKSGRKIKVPLGFPTFKEVLSTTY